MGALLLIAATGCCSSETRSGIDAAIAADLSADLDMSRPAADLTGCIGNDDCPDERPICDGASCRACAAHAECASRLCGMDGRCAAPASVAYADNRGGTCTGVHAATLADPACDISAALAVQPIVRVLGSSTAYPYLSISSGDAGGGLQLTNSPYTIINSFIVGNVGSGPAVLFNSGNTAVAPGFAHNTIANDTAGGIQCNAATTIASSIVTGNTPMDTSGSCTLPGSTSMAPDFVSAGDWHLAGRTAANLACCIDRVAASPLDHDFDGRARPVGAGWDVGAHEVP